MCIIFVYTILLRSPSLSDNALLSYSIYESLASLPSLFSAPFPHVPDGHVIQLKPTAEFFTLVGG